MKACCCRRWGNRVSGCTWHLHYTYDMIATFFTVIPQHMAIDCDPHTTHGHTLGSTPLARVSTAIISEEGASGEENAREFDMALEVCLFK